MELSNIPIVNGRRNFEGINRLASITCTEREFAEIVGVSRGYVNRLKQIGVIETNFETGRNARILLGLSLREYRQYLRQDKLPALDARLIAGGYDAFMV